MTDHEIRECLRLKYIPHTEGFDAEEIKAYERFLALSDEAQRLHMAAQNDDKFELYVQLIISHAMYTAPVDRSPGSITQEKVDAYPDRYNWWPR